MSQGAASDADIQLTAEQQAFILELHDRLGSGDHYALLGVARDADRKTIKRAYFELVRRVHPDRYFGKRLGPFRSKMETLVTHLSRALEALESVVPSSARIPVPSSTPAKAAVSPDEALAKARAREASAARHFATAKLARAAGDLGAATEALRLALTLTPKDEALRKAYDEVQRAAADHEHESLVRQAQLEERHQHWAEAAASWERVLRARPQDSEAKARFQAAASRVRPRRAPER